MIRILGGTLIFSFIRRIGHWGGGVKDLNFNMFEGFRKMNILGGMKILRIFLGSS